MLVEQCEFKPKKKSDEVVWKFTCDNSSIKSKWVSYLAQLREQFLQESKKDKNPMTFTQVEEKHENQSNYSSVSNKSKAPWRESTTMRKQYSTNDFKSMADLTGTEADHYFDEPQKNEIIRMSSTYAPQVDMEAFGLENEY